MGREFELKYRATVDAQAAIAAAFGSGFEEISMETTYYDTPDRQLSAQRYTLRRRLENGVSVCTIKTPAKGHGRGEWEFGAQRIEDAIPELCKLGGPESLLAFTDGQLVPICAARFTRLAKTVVLDNCTLELALDRGVLTGGGRELPFTEVEVELKDGSEEAAAEFAKALAAELKLKEEPRSKVARAIALTEK